MKSKRFFSFLVKNYSTIIALIILAVFIGFYVLLISKTFYIDNDGNIRTAIAGYGDIPLHMTQMTKFAFTKWNLEEPIFAGTKLQYPFMINFLSGVTLKLTGFWRFSFLWPPILFTIISSILGYVIYKKFLKNSLIAVIALIVFFFGSGMGAYKFIEESHNAQEIVSVLTNDAISTITKWDAEYPNQNIDYGAPISLTIHQRPFFIGFLLFLIVIISTLKIMEKPKSKLPLIAGILSYGLLPMSHMHSFVAATIFIFSLFILLLVKKDETKLNKIFLLGIIGFIIASPQIYYLIGKKDILGQAASFFSFRVGWMVEPTIGSVKFVGKESIFTLTYLKFLWVNFGVILVLFIISTIILFFKKITQKIFDEKELFHFKLFLLSGWILFLTVMLFRFQPWDYDNNKILVYWQFFAVLGIFYIFIKLYKFQKIIVGILVGIFVILAIYSGILDQVFRVNKNFDEMPIIFSLEARELAEYVKYNIPEKDLILTGNSHLNTISSLTGRPVLEGFPGWLWTRGINYSEREEDIKNFYSNPISYVSIIQKYNIKYILIDNQTNFDFDSNLKTFGKTYINVFNSGQYNLFKIQS